MEVMMVNINELTAIHKDLYHGTDASAGLSNGKNTAKKIIVGATALQLESDIQAKIVSDRKRDKCKIQPYPLKWEEVMQPTSAQSTSDKV
eukprot:15332149-Ditylum_brightwellii.AAC.1